MGRHVLRRSSEHGAPFILERQVSQFGVGTHVVLQKESGVGGGGGAGVREKRARGGSLARIIALVSGRAHLGHVNE